MTTLEKLRKEVDELKRELTDAKRRGNFWSAELIEIYANRIDFALKAVENEHKGGINQTNE